MSSGEGEGWGKGEGRGNGEEWRERVRRGDREKHQWQHPCSDSIHSSLGPPPPPPLPPLSTGVKMVGKRAGSFF